MSWSASSWRLHASGATFSRVVYSQKCRGHCKKWRGLVERFDVVQQRLWKKYMHSKVMGTYMIQLLFAFVQKFVVAERWLTNVCITKSDEVICKKWRDQQCTALENAGRELPACAVCSPRPVPAAGHNITWHLQTIARLKYSDGRMFATTWFMSKSKNTKYFCTSQNNLEVMTVQAFLALDFRPHWCFWNVLCDTFKSCSQ